ncbi:hypothetical protein [Streptomyces sp. NPDC058985]|uniref:hypothetical protein n=1 Tax=Streptomyces sp. NPDC058985 TaxID=3346684 RepID=UPI0036CB8084
MSQPNATVLERQVELRVTGQPDVKNMYGSGHIRPMEVTFRYQAEGLRAEVYGQWVREDGEVTDARCSNRYTAPEGDVAEWPAWLAEMATAWRPTPAAPAPADTLAAWLHRRFEPRDVDWEQLGEDDRSYWEHQARAVRRAVARGGFKQPAAEAQPGGAE